MKTITKTINVFSFTELSQKAKDFAVSRNEEHDHYHWASDNKASLKAFADHFDFLTVKDWSYDSYSGWAHIDIETPYEWEDGDLEDLAGSRLYTFLLGYMEKFKKYKVYHTGSSEYDKNIKKHVSKINWSYENNCQLTGYCIDCSLMDFIFEYLENFPKYKDLTMQDLMQKCLDNWISDCVSDIEYYFSEESLEEQSTANDWYYYEDGKFYGSINESEVA